MVSFIVVPLFKGVLRAMAQSAAARTSGSLPVILRPADAVRQ
jgi:hypothetical protein